MLCTDNLKVINNKDKTLIANTVTGKYIIVNRKYYEILVEAEKSSLDINTFSLIKEEKIYLSKLSEIIKKLGESSKVRKFESVFLLCTNTCNLNCPHCSKESGSNNFDKLSSENLKKIMDKVARLQPDSITLSGGEPLCRKNFVSELKYLNSIYKGHIILATNSLLITEDNIKDIVNNIYALSISLDGVNEETCSKIRGNGYYDKVISKIGLLKKMNFDKISLSMLLTKENEKYKDEFISLCRKLECKPILRRFTPVGRGVESKNLMSSLEGQAIEINKNTISAKECKPGIRKICINEEGNIYPCQLLNNDSYKLGNILTDGRKLEEILSEKYIDMEIEKSRPYNAPECKECKVNIFCWSCIGNYQNIKKDKDIFRELCNFKHKHLMKYIWNE